MQAPRTGGGNRFDAAKSEAALRVTTLNGQVGGLAGGVYVFKFFRSFLGAGGLIPQTDPVTGNICAPAAFGGTGVCTAGQAVRAINAAVVTSELTPLAGSLCDSIDVASGSGSGATTERLLDVYSDGAENFTDPAHACFGPPSGPGGAPFDLGSWQNKVYMRATGASPAITINATLYNDVSAFTGPTTTSSVMVTYTPPGGGHTLPGARLAPSGAVANLTYAAVGTVGTVAPVEEAAKATSPFSLVLSDADFFAILAADTGGFYREVHDDEPLPVVGDMDGDFDVDRFDAIAIARKFGDDPTFETDLDGDDAVGYGDYLVVLSLFGNGTGTPEADPYTQHGVVSCVAGATVVLDGVVIESDGTAINGLNACNVIIRNSLIVSGNVAIRTRGVGLVTVEDSIIVGEDGWLTSTGKATLLARDSVFHGRQTTIGTFRYVNRGGNTFE